MQTRGKTANDNRWKTLEEIRKTKEKTRTSEKVQARKRSKEKGDLTIAENAGKEEKGALSIAVNDGKEDLLWRGCVITGRKAQEIVI